MHIKTPPPWESYTTTKKLTFKGRILLWFPI